MRRIIRRKIQHFGNVRESRSALLPAVKLRSETFVLGKVRKPSQCNKLWVTAAFREGIHHVADAAQIPFTSNSELQKPAAAAVKHVALRRQSESENGTPAFNFTQPVAPFPCRNKGKNRSILGGTPKHYC